MSSITQPQHTQGSREILSVLKPGVEFRVMIYNKYSVIGFMLWAHYALLAGRPLRTLDDVYANQSRKPWHQDLYEDFRSGTFRWGAHQWSKASGL